jgi:hypothetical protein
MVQNNRLARTSTVIRHHPLQAAKFAGILLSLVLGVAGFFRIVDATALFGDSILADGQLLAIVAIPLIGLGLVCIVFVETLVSGYRSVRSDDSVGEQLASRPGYLLVRGVEATIGVVGVTIMVTALPTLFAASTPAPAGVGIMLLLLVVGLAILCASLVRATVELVVYADVS